MREDEDAPSPVPIPLSGRRTKKGLRFAALPRLPRGVEIIGRSKATQPALLALTKKNKK